MKTTRKLLSILLSVLLVLSVTAVASAEDATWVPIKTSDDTLEKGDLYLDLASIKDVCIERAVYQNLVDYVQPKDPHWSPSDPPRFNNLSVVACEKLATLYPALWEAALEETLAEYNEEYPSYNYTAESFYVIQDTWYPFFEKVRDAHPELGFTSWGGLADYGYDYISEEYPDALTQAAAAAETDFARYENADWSYDGSFTSSWNWLKAELDGEAIPMIPEEIKGTFTEYGVEWQPVAADIASVEGEGGFYLNGNAIEVALGEEELAYYEQQGEWMYERYVDRLPTTIWVGPGENDVVEVADEAQLREVIDGMVAAQIASLEAQMAEYYASFFDGATLLVNPDEDSLFQISFTKTYTNYGGSHERTSYYPMTEKRSPKSPVTAEAIWNCVNAYQWTWNGEAASVTVTTGLGEEIETVAADVAFETTTEPQVGVTGEKLATATATVNDTELTATKSFVIPALDPPEEPTQPDAPTEPDTPAGENLCPWDQVDHGTSFCGRLVSFFHKILYFIVHLFGLK